MPFIRHSCPICGTRVGRVRRWLKPWIWARWHCEGCGTRLRFDFCRRLLGVLLVVPAFPIAGWLATLVEPSWGLAGALALALVMGTIGAFVVFLVDAVEVYDSRSLDTSAHGDA